MRQADRSLSLPRAKDRILLAADYRSPEEAWPHILALGHDVGGIKIELPLFMRGGEQFIKGILEAGFRVFLDLKAGTIPSQAAEAAAVATYWGVSFFTLQASGGAALMAHAQERVRETSRHMGLGRPKIQLLGVTVPTNLTAFDFENEGLSADIRSLVVRRAELALEAGLAGAVCSPQEVAHVRNACGSDFTIVATGIRDGASDDDQRRTGSAYFAVLCGADYIVVGRPVITHPVPHAKIQNIVNDIARAEKVRTEMVACKGVNP